MLKIIEQNDKYTLGIEFMGKRHGGYWLELIERATGKVKILMSENKNAFEGVKIDHALRWTQRDVWKPMYKANKK